MKESLTFFALFLSAAVAFGSPLALNREFVTAALGALRSAASLQTFDLSEPSEFAAKVNDASDRARTPAEQKTLRLLMEFADAKAKNNRFRSLVLENEERQWRDEHTFGTEATLAEARPGLIARLAQIPYLQQMVRREERCAVAIDGMLRKSVYVAQPECAAVYDEDANVAHADLLTK